MNRKSIRFCKSYVPACFRGKKDALRPSAFLSGRDVVFLCKKSVYVPTSLNVLFTSPEREVRPYVPLLYIGGDWRDVTSAAQNMSAKLATHGNVTRDCNVTKPCLENR